MYPQKVLVHHKTRMLPEVLLAMHKSEFDATHGIRLSFSYENTLEEAKYFIETCKEIIENYGLSL